MEWWQEAVFYQIYPRSFFDSNGDGVGDVNGIRAKLDYLVELGVDALWVSPMFTSPMRDFGYDVADYCNVDEIFGSLDDLDALVREVHERNMKIILDWVPNHSSSDHPWFQEAKTSPSSPKRDWYIWRRANDDGSLPNNWIRAWSDESVWTLDEHSGEYYLHCFLPSQPDLNWDNVALRRAMHDTLRFWLDRGIDGFRMDVIHLIGKELDVNDDPELAPLSHVPLNDVAVTHTYLREIRAVLDEFDDRVSVGEVYLFDPERVASYYGQGDELHMSFNFASLMTPWRATAWRDLIAITEAAHQRAQAWPTWVMSNHDNARVASRLGGDPQKVRAAMLLLLTLRGTPFLYAGEELGLLDAVITPADVVDPGGRDGCRAPLPWTDEEFGGWPTRPWLPVVGELATLNAHSQRLAANSMWTFTRELIQARRELPALSRGEIAELKVEGDLLTFVRSCEGQRVGVAVNFAPTVASLPWNVSPAPNKLLNNDGTVPGFGAAWVSLDLA